MQPRTRVLAASMLAALALLAAATASAAPSWAKEGNWAKYRMEVNIHLNDMAKSMLGIDQDSITATIDIKATITDVNDEEFTVTYEVESAKVEPESPFSSEILSSIKDMAIAGMVETYRFDAGPESAVSDIPIYVSPQKLPSNGVVEKTTADSNILLKYDKATGWLKEAKMTMSTPAGPMEMTVKIIDSNFIGGVGLGGGILALGIVGAAVAVVAAVILVLAKRK